MARIKIKELAEQLGVSIDEVIDIAKKLGAKPKTPSSSVENEIAFKVRASVGVRKSSDVLPVTSPEKTEKLPKANVTDKTSVLSKDLEDAVSAAEAALQAGQKTKKSGTEKESLLPPVKKKVVVKKKVIKKKPLPLGLQQEIEAKKTTTKAPTEQLEPEEVVTKAAKPVEPPVEVKVEEPAVKEVKVEEKAEVEKKEPEVAAISEPKTETETAESEVKAKIEEQAPKPEEAPEKAKKEPERVEKSHKEEAQKVEEKARPIEKEPRKEKQDTIVIEGASRRAPTEKQKPKKSEQELAREAKQQTERDEYAQRATEEFLKNRAGKHDNPEVLAKLPKTAQPIDIKVKKPKRIEPVKLPPLPKEKLVQLSQPLYPDNNFGQRIGTRPPRPSTPRPSTPRPSGGPPRRPRGADQAPAVTPVPEAIPGKKRGFKVGREKKDKARDEVGVNEPIPTGTYIVDKHHHFVVRRKKSGKSRRESGTTKTQKVETKKEAKLTLEIFAKTVGVPEHRIMSFMLKNGIVPNPDEELKGDLLAVLSNEFGLETSEEGKLAEENLVPRSPIVTVMGHVDHGKTTLLDYIRKANVVSGEAGGITQSIGAHKVKIGNRGIVFIDTPGHEAFSAMRREGANITDVVILVVAATEGIKEQTLEAINMAKAAKVSIVVAANKMDLPGANIDRLKGELAEIDLTPEDWGGKTIVVPISAKKGDGVQELMEMVLLQADIMELKMNKGGKLAGTIIESHMDKFVGPLATAIVQSGTLKVGDYVEAGNAWGRVKALYDDHDKRVKSVTCVTPVKIMGFDVVPKPGQVILASDKSRRRLTEKKLVVTESNKEEVETDSPSSLDELFAAYEKQEEVRLNVVVKTDSEGSLDAVRFALSKIKLKDVPVNIVFSGIGVINDNDILLAETSNALLLGFNVQAEANAKKTAKQKSVNILTFNIIFELTDAVMEVLKGLVKPEFQDILIGKAEVRQVFGIGGVGNIAGCLVHEGKARKDSKVKLIRNRMPIYESTIETLKHFKDDVTEVKSGYECGIRLKDYEDIKPGDILEFYEVKEVK